MTIFSPVFAISGIVSWKVNLVFLLILNLAEGDESLHVDIVPLFAVSLLPRTMQWDGSIGLRDHSAEFLIVLNRMSFILKTKLSI